LQTNVQHYLKVDNTVFKLYIYFLGAKVILACRNVEKANDAIEDIKRNPFPR